MIISAPKYSCYYKFLFLHRMINRLISNHILNLEWPYRIEKHKYFDYVIVVLYLNSKRLIFLLISYVPLLIGLILVRIIWIFEMQFNKNKITVNDERDIYEYINIGYIFVRMFSIKSRSSYIPLKLKLKAYCSRSLIYFQI